MAENTENGTQDAATSELEAAKKEAELAKKEAELAKKEAELAKKQASGVGGKEKGGKKKTVAIIVSIVVILVLIGVILYLLNLKGIISFAKDDQVPNNVVTKDNVEDIMKELDKEETPPGSYEVSMTMEWTFANGSSVSKDAYLENVEANNNSVYATVELADTGEEIYKSPVLKTGTHIQDIKLDKALAKGEYNCVCTYHLLNKSETDDESTTKISLKIVVKK